MAELSRAQGINGLQQAGWSALVALCVLTWPAASPGKESAADLPGGLVAVAGGASDLALELAQRPGTQVFVQTASADRMRQLRHLAAELHLGHDRILISQGDLDEPQLAHNLADAVVLDGGNAAISAAAWMPVLHPGGVLLHDGRRQVKPWPAEMDFWTHPYHGPDNNPLSTDKVARAPYLTQFLADPRYGPAPQVAVAAGGRVFKVFGNVAWHEREEPHLNRILAYDGFNGRVLWSYALPRTMMVHRNVFVATDDTLYVGDHLSCKKLDARTGKLKGELRPPVGAAGGTFWKWMALKDGVLYALMGQAEPEDQPSRWKRTQHGWPWNQISRGYNVPQQPWGYGRTILAIDPDSGKVLWTYREAQPVDARAVCMNGKQLFAFQFNQCLTCLDTETGKVIWRKTPENDPRLFEVIGKPLGRQGWQTNWRTTAYLKCTDQALYFAGPQVNKLAAVSAVDGRLLWQDPYDNYQLVIQPDALYGISGPWGTNVSKKFDPLTGKVLAELPTGRRACTRPNGTCDSILYRAMGGSVRFDLDTLQPRWVSPMRPGCHDGVTISNGLLYWWPYTCDCQLSLYGVTCVGSADGFDFRPDWRDATRRQQLASSDQVTPLATTAADWPTFRGNNRATATCEAVVPDTARQLWITRLPGAPSLTAPVAVGQHLFVGDGEGTVSSLQASDGSLQWQLTTGGAMRLPPTIWKGRAIAGSGDGWVYACDATTGRLLWKYRAAPAERRIPVYGRLLSTWPVASGVLVQDDTAYLAAGLVNYDGTYVYALDPVTGSVRWCNDTSGHLDSQANVGVSVQGHLLADKQTLYLAGGNAVSPARYDLADGRCLNDAEALARCESTSPRGWELYLVGKRVIACGKPFYSRPELPVYDHTVSKKLFHSSTHGRDVVLVDDQTLMGFDNIDSQALTDCVTDERIPRHITQAWGSFQIKQQPQWTQRCPGTLSVAVGRNAVVIADAKQLAAYDLDDGHVIWTVPLPAAPIRWGMALDRQGRAIVALTDGRVVAVGQPNQLP